MGDCDEIGLYICELSRSFMIEHILLKNGFWNFNLKFWKGNSYQYDDVKIFDTSVLVVDTSSLNSEFYSMSSKEKKRIRNFWIKALPFLINVEYLMTTHQIDQEFFDAICEMKNLKGLYIKWGKIESCKKIEKLILLEHLYFGSNPRLPSFEGFESLRNLKHLEVENVKPLADFSPLENLDSLITLKITGTVDKALSIDNLYFLNKFKNIEELTLGISLKIKDLEPLKNLEKLRYLWLPASLLKKFEKEKLE